MEHFQLLKTFLVLGQKLKFGILRSWYFKDKPVFWWNQNFIRTMQTELGTKKLVAIKLRGLGPTNRIINDSDFKPSKFERQFQYDSNLTTKIGF